MSRAPRMNRRAFLASAAAAGGALALGFDIPLGPRTIRASESASEITVWIVIEPDDTVIIRVAKSEMGQGSFTALPMLVAEELECDWNKVKAEFASPHENRKRNRAWGNMSTGASRSITASQNDLRRAGATARELLIAAAAAAWKVPAKECVAANSVMSTLQALQRRMDCADRAFRRNLELLIKLQAQRPQPAPAANGFVPSNSPVPAPTPATHPLVPAPAPVKHPPPLPLTA